MPEDFRGLGIGPPDYWAPLALAEQFRATLMQVEEDEIAVEVVGRLKPGMSPDGGDGRAQRVGVGTSRT